MIWLLRRSASRFAASAAITGVALLCGPASAEMAKPIVALAPLAGAWAGVVRLPSGQHTYVTLMLKADGTYEAISPQSRSDGEITIEEGRARFRSARGTSGTVTLLEDLGREILRFVSDDGRSRADYERK